MKLRMSHILTVFFLLCSLIFLYLLVRNSFLMTGYQQFSYLAKSFLEGSLSFTQNYDGWWHDAVLFQGQYYWPLGPLPGVILMPFQYVANSSNVIFFQGYLQPFLVLIVFVVLYKIARKLQLEKLDSAFLSFGFIAATTFLGVAMWPNSWFFAQIITTILIFMSLLEFVGKRRYWLIGIIFGLVILTRYTASVGVIFFLMYILWKEKSKFSKLFQIGLGAFPFFVIALCYNYARFGSFFEQGYSYQNVAGVFGYVQQFGLFNPIYVPANLYYMLIAPPIPQYIEGTKLLAAPFFKADAWGMGLLFTSPIIFLTFLSGKWRTPINKLLLLTSVIVSLPILLYYGIGWYQFGYRYSLDFLPFLFVMLVYNLSERKKKIGDGLKFAILISALINMYLFSTIFIL